MSAPVPDPTALRERIAAFARPRLAGTTAAAATVRSVTDHLQALGYEVRRLPFEYSALPGLYGLPLLGLTLTVCAVMAAVCLEAGQPAVALAILTATAAGTAAALAALPAALRRLPLARRPGTNLLAVPGHGRRAASPGVTGSRPVGGAVEPAPMVLLMAHFDSKSQGLPTLGRTVAAVAAILGWTGLTTASLAGLLGASPAWLGDGGQPLGAGGAMLAGAGGLALAAARTGNRSPGALDNATGLVALLELARRLRDLPVLFLVTDAEELGLAGARAAVDRLPPVAAVINLDGLDDRGRLRVSHSRRRPHGLLETFRAAAAGEGAPLTTGPLPVGLLTDHVPFAGAGLPAVTVMRGSAASLLRVHTAADGPDRLDGAGVAEAVAVVERVTRALAPVP